MAVTNIAYLNIKTGVQPVFFIYLPRRIEINVPNKPTTPKPMITNPIGTRPVCADDWSAGIVGITRAGGGVNVGSLVGGISTIN